MTARQWHRSAPTYDGMLPTNRTPPLPTRSTPGNGIRQYRWPSQRHLTPTHCACGSVLIANDVPTASYPLTDVTCLLCSRVACELIADSAPVRMTAAEYAALPQQAPRRPADPAGTAMQRLVTLLTEQGPLTARQIAAALDIGEFAVRNAVALARKRNHDVAITGGRYWMERGR